MKRNLKFWTRYTWESIGADMVFMAILAVLAVFGSEGLDFRMFASVMPYFLCVGAMFGMVIINASSHMLYVPLLLSMGETRRNVLLGFHYYRALIIAVTTALCALIWLLVPGEVSALGLRSIPTLLCILIIAAAFGSLMGTMFVKWKWAGTILIIILCGGIGGCMGMTGVAAAEGTFFSGDMTVSLAECLVELPWWLVLAALALLAIDLLFQWTILRRQEVKF